MKWFGFALALVVAVWVAWYLGVLQGLETVIDDWFTIVSAR
jgi:hypothetical protein